MVTHPLRTFRKKQQPPLTKAALARLLEVSKTAVARWEQGSRKIDPELLPEISKRTGIPGSALRPDLARKLSEVAE